MTGVGTGMPRDFREFVVDTRKRITALERRQVSLGGTDLSGLITAGSGIDITGTGTTGDPLVISSTFVGPAPLPPPLTIFRTADSYNVTSTTLFGQTLFTGSITVEYPLWVTLDYAGWLNTAASTDVRAGVALSGATTLAAQIDQATSGSVWGDILYLNVTGTSYQLAATKTVLLNPGTTTFSYVAYRTGSGTTAVNYPTLQVVPVAWSGAPGVVTPFVASFRATARNATNPSITGSVWSLISNLTNVERNIGFTSWASNALTIAYPGVYAIACQAAFATTGGATRMETRVSLNSTDPGSNNLNSRVFGKAVGINAVYGQGRISLVAGDVLRPYCMTETTTRSLDNNDSCFFEVEYLHP